MQFQDDRPAAWLLAALAAQASDRPVEVPDAWRPVLAAADLSPEAAEWLAVRLDQIVPNWRDAAAPPSPADWVAERPVGGSERPYGMRESALETSGCGDMRLTMTLDSVTVHERDDNFVGDQVYCMVRAQDYKFEESVFTEISDNLGPGETYDFADGVFYGREVGRDPGDELHILYDCWEHDGAEDYDKIREVVEAARRIGKALEVVAPNVSGYILVAAQVTSIATELASALDGDDHLYHDEETLTRQGLWEDMNAGPRRIAARGTHLGGDWAWELAVSARGCATGESAPAPGSEPCGPANCDGCCVGDRCEMGTTTQSCGAGGAICHSCDAMDVCNSGSCVFNPSSLFDVVVYSGTVAATKPGGSCWDFSIGACDDPPDVYVRVAVGGQNGSTSISPSWSPQWEESVLTSVSARDLMSVMSIEMWDDDISSDDLICRQSLSVSEAMLRDGEARVDCGSTESLVLRFLAR